MKKRIGRFGFVFYFAFLFLLIFTMLYPGSRQLPCQKSCCHVVYKSQTEPENQPESRCSLSIPAEKNCLECSSRKNGSHENRNQLRCPIEVCCQPSEMPTRLSVTLDRHPERDSFVKFVRANHADMGLPPWNDGIFSIPLQPLPVISKLPLFLKNCILII